MKKTFVLFFLSSALFAQEEPSTSQFWNNYSQFNPAMTGFEVKHQGGITFRDKWDKLYGSPKLLTGNYDLQINKKHSVGINFDSFQNYGNEVNAASLNYSYKLIFKEAKKHFVSVGAGVGVGTLKYNNLIFGNDFQNWPQVLKPSTFPKLNLGLAYNWNKFMVGFGATQITGDSGVRGSYRPGPHYYGIAAYRLKVCENFDLIPRFQFKMVQNFHTIDINLMVTFKKKYSLSAGVRNTDTFVFLFQYDVFEKLRLGYSYDWQVSKLNNGALKPTHEFVIGFRLKEKS